MNDDDVVEIAARIGADGAKPVPVRKTWSRHMEGLMKVVKEYEKYTVIAARDGDDDAAMNALMIHPLVGDYKRAHACYYEMKQAHMDFLPQFFKK